MSHTPGPWESMLIHGDNHIIRKGSFRKEGAGSVSYQCVVDCVDDIDDARLIAAAPELLEALHSIVLNANPALFSPGQLEQAREAIAKATVTAR